MVNSRRGRPQGDRGTRDNILRVALSRFSASGYSAVSVREVARQAGVDHALVHYYFGSKEGLFRAAMGLAATPGQLIDEVVVRASQHRLGSAVLQEALMTWDDPDAGSGLAGMVQEAFSQEAVMQVVRDYLETAVIGRLAQEVGGRSARQRAAAAGAVVAGVFFSRYVVRVEPLASMTPEEVVAAVGPSVDRALVRDPPGRAP